MKTKTLTLSIAALAFALAGGAQAAAVAYVSLELSQFGITTTGVTSTNYGSLPRKTEASAIYTVGSTNSASAAYNATSDVAQQKAGSGPFPGENAFSYYGLANAARGDARTEGNPLTQSATLVENVAEAQSSSPIAATASGSNTNSVGFTVQDGASISINFLGRLRYQADTDAVGEIATVIAQAAFTLIGVGETQTPANSVWNAYTLGSTYTDGNGVALSDTTTSKSYTWSGLPAGTYTLTSISLSKAEITAVPEVTSSLALLGLFGLGLTNRRRRMVA